MLAAVRVNDLVQVVVSPPRQQNPLMKGLAVMLYVAGSAVAATVKHLLAVTDAQGVEIAAKPKCVSLVRRT